MTRTFWPFVALLLLTGVAAAADEPRFSTPEIATEVLQARDLAVKLHYDPAQWNITPQDSTFALLARFVHKDGWVSGAFVYRDEPSTREAVRRRAREELENAFESYEIVGFSPRVVNGAPVMFMKANATSGDGEEAVIRTYYWLGPGAVVDYSLVTKRRVFDQYRQPMMDLLNGLEIAPGESEESGAQ